LAISARKRRRRIAWRLRIPRLQGRAPRPALEPGALCRGRRLALPRRHHDVASPARPASCECDASQGSLHSNDSRLPPPLQQRCLKNNRRRAPIQDIFLLLLVSPAARSGLAPTLVAVDGRTTEAHGALARGLSGAKHNALRKPALQVPPCARISPTDLARSFLSGALLLARSLSFSLSLLLPSVSHLFFQMGICLARPRLLPLSHTHRHIRSLSFASVARGSSLLSSLLFSRRGRINSGLVYQALVCGTDRGAIVPPYSVGARSMNDNEPWHSTHRCSGTVAPVPPVLAVWCSTTGSCAL